MTADAGILAELRAFIEEAQYCERCGWTYDRTAALGCRPGNCSQRPLPALRPGRTPDGGFTEEHPFVARLRAADEERKTPVECAREEERERAAKICERMVAGGRAWTKEQAVAADALFAAAQNIRALGITGGKADG